ncbi:MAG TPA: MlaD family protein [Gemmatimonadales bacterium]|nr:MlaD family protein [Gemmatimonadales bacterium]
MRTRTADMLIGLLVVGTALVTLVAIVVTRGWTERRITIYMLSPTVQDLKQDTPVYLQGLAIGEVAAISPLADTTIMVAPQFVVALRLREKFANGIPIHLPRGTVGRILSSGLIGSASISLDLPTSPNQGPLSPGDTIPGNVTQGWSDVVKEVADTLKTQVSDILRETRALLKTLDHTASTADTELATTGPQLRETLGSARQVLDRLGPMIQQAQTTVASTDQRLGVMQDSLTLLLADTRRLINRADSLTSTVSATARDLRPALEQTFKNVYVLTEKANYFFDAVSRRPHRLFTGVPPLPTDSLLQAAP